MRAEIDFDKEARRMAKSLYNIVRPNFLAEVLGMVYSTFYRKTRGYYKFDTNEYYRLLGLYESLEDYIG